MAINVSPLQLMDPGFSAQVLDILDRHRIPTTRIILEISESALMQDVDSCRQQLLELSARGVQISLDDFGVGFSSLARLKQLPIDELKIDRAFVSDIHRNEVDVSIISAIVALAAILGLRVVAEGVENERQLRTVEQLGCAQSQGYLHDPPLSGQVFLARHGRSGSYVAGERLNPAGAPARG